MLLEPDTFGITLLLFSLACLGTWPALLRLCCFHEKKTNLERCLPSTQDVRVAQDAAARSILANNCEISVTCIWTTRQPIFLFHQSHY
jgi:hypothetical protein